MRRESTLAAFKSMAGGMSERLMAMATTAVCSLNRIPLACLPCWSPEQAMLQRP